MLKIRSEQLAAFEREPAEVLAQSVAEKLARAGGRSATEHDVEIVGEQVRRARSHGLGSRRAICRYLVIAHLLGRDFDQSAWAKRVLDDQSLGEAEKVERLTRWARERLVAGDGRASEGSEPT